MNELWALPFAIIYAVGFFLWPFATSSLGPDTWHLVLLIRVATQVGSALILAVVTGGMMGGARNVVLSVPIGLAFGLMPCFFTSNSTLNAALDLAHGPVEGDVLASSVTRYRATRGGAHIKVLVTLRTEKGEEFEIQPGFAGTDLTCDNGMPLEHALVLRHAGIVLSYTCGDGVLYKACRSGDREACASAMAAANRAIGRAAGIDVDWRGVAWENQRFHHGSACGEGSMDDCYRAGFWTLADEDAENSKELAERFFSKACKGGEPHACAISGYATLLDGNAADLGGARETLKLACAKGVALACNWTARVQ